MRAITVAMALLLLCAEAECSQKVRVRVTCYAPDEPGSDYYTRRRQSSTGVRLAWGHAATSPRWHGKRIRLECGLTVVSVDTIGTSKAGHGRPVVDVFFPTWRAARRWDDSNPDFMWATVGG